MTATRMTPTEPPEATSRGRQLSTRAVRARDTLTKLYLTRFSLILVSVLIGFGPFALLAVPAMFRSMLVLTPIGLAFGLYEAHRLAGGLVFIMAALIAVMGVAMASVVMTIRRERKKE